MSHGRTWSRRRRQRRKRRVRKKAPPGHPGTRSSLHIHRQGQRRTLVMVSGSPSRGTGWRVRTPPAVTKAGEGGMGRMDRLLRDNIADIVYIAASLVEEAIQKNNNTTSTERFATHNKRFALQEKRFAIMGCYDFAETYDTCESWKDAWNRWYKENQACMEMDSDEDCDDEEMCAMREAYENGYGVKDGCTYVGKKDDVKAYIEKFLDTHDWSDLKWQNAICVGDASKDKTYTVFGVMSC